MQPGPAERLSEVSAAKVPAVEIDADGEVITGYIVADNYFEMYVNGKLVSVDNTPYTPFNSAIVKFRAKRPYTIAIMGVDWDEHLGLGMELFPSVGPNQNAWHPGDGGVILKLSDGTVTDSTWKAQTFYIAPLNKPDEVVERVLPVRICTIRNRSEGCIRWRRKRTARPGATPYTIRFPPTGSPRASTICTGRARTSTRT
jgi:hypothetical protein